MDRAVIVVVNLAAVATARPVFERMLDTVNLVAQTISEVQKSRCIGADNIKMLVIGAGEIIHCLALPQLMPACASPAPRRDCDGDE